jgi:hypothetical protein
VFVVDLRSELDVAAIPFAIPGALRIAAEGWSGDTKTSRATAT